ncbi:hypothetical protein CCR96_22555 [Halochromatium roseum]|nr:hypothetical protein [Halochromatium roseum]
MAFPYGLADYRALIKEGYLYIDRSDRLPLIEQTGRQLIFLRRRRFGKTLWLSLLARMLHKPASQGKHRPPRGKYRA